jgi:hypothetical protein
MRHFEEGAMSRHFLLRCALVLTLCAAVLPVPAHAGLADLIPHLFENTVRLASNPDPNRDHAAHFVDPSGTLSATGTALNESLVSQLSTFPMASSAGGFTYTFDPALGTYERASESFGPSFTERAQTIGAKKWNVGVNYLQAEYESLDGLDLEAGDIEFQLRHIDSSPPVGGTPPQPFFEGDLINVNTSIDVESATSVFFATYGLTDAFDVSVSMPVVSVDLSAQALLTVDRLATAANPGIHVFPDGSSTSAFQDSDSASGIGDVLLRGKWRFADLENGGVAALLDIRFPTGDEEELLGTGFTQGKLSFIGSGTFGKLSTHANLGYSTSSGDSATLSDLPDELDYRAGLDFAAHPRFTLSGEVVGRTLFDATTAVLGQEPFSFVMAGGTTTLTELRPVVHFVEDDLDLLLGVLGMKFNPTGNLLLTANAMFGLSDDGLEQDGVIGVLGVEYSF